MGLNIGLDAGGELGCCYATSRKTACFLAAGGGVSFGTPQGGASIGLSGSMTFTALRDIGDAQGHALTAGVSIGDYSLNAVWAVGGDADALEQRMEDNGGDGKGFIDQMMSTAFVGITYGKSVDLLTKDGFLPPSSGDFSASIVCRVLTSNRQIRPMPNARTTHRLSPCSGATNLRTSGTRTAGACRRSSTAPRSSALIWARSASSWHCMARPNAVPPWRSGHLARGA